MKKINFLFLCFIILLNFFVNFSFSAISSSSDYELLSSAMVNSGGEWIKNSDYSLRGASGQNIANDSKNKNNFYTNRDGYYNPAYFSYQKVLPVNFSNNNMNINLPENSIDKETFDIFYNTDKNTMLYKDEIFNADKKILRNKGIPSYPIKTQEIYFMDEESLSTNDFKNEGKISFKIQDINNDGIVDGSNPLVRVDTLKVYNLYIRDSLWLKTFNDNLDKTNNLLSFSFTKPGTYSLMGEISTSVKDVYAYPVPFRPNGPNKGNSSGETGTDENGITFANIPQTGYIEIYTVDARLVKKIDIPYGIAVSILTWDTKNDSGQKVASGVYIYRIVSENNSKTGKIIIIR